MSGYIINMHTLTETCKLIPAAIEEYKIISFTVVILKSFKYSCHPFSPIYDAILLAAIFFLLYHFYCF